MTTDNGGQEQQWCKHSWRSIAMPSIERDPPTEPRWCSLCGALASIGRVHIPVNTDPLNADHAQATQAQRYREALERIANTDWRIISGSIGPLMNVGYSMAGEQASKIARDALAPSTGQEEGRSES